MTITISRSRARMLRRALQVFATANPEDMAKITASDEAFSLKLALEREGGGE